MIASPTAVPVPIPQLPGGSPATWPGKALVDASFTFRGRALTATYIGVDIGNPDKSGAISPTTITDSSAYLQIGSMNLRSAVEAASVLASNRPLRGGFNQATAVMQAGDGAYYLCALLSQVDGEPVYLPIDGSADLVVQDVASRNPDLRAVVGAHSWVNFSGTDVSPTLAGE